MCRTPGVSKSNKFPAFISKNTCATSYDENKGGFHPASYSEIGKESTRETGSRNHFGRFSDREEGALTTLSSCPLSTESDHIAADNHQEGHRLVQLGANKRNQLMSRGRRHNFRDRNMNQELGNRSSRSSKPLLFATNLRTRPYRLSRGFRLKRRHKPEIKDNGHLSPTKARGSRLGTVCKTITGRNRSDGAG